MNFLHLTVPSPSPASSIMSYSKVLANLVRDLSNATA
ncbi:uncharacterized protein CTRU02_213507 [Colletotrichum truncatum]|uniref:Uncharacterized protein n=1 Tax=Colletotrichum truncatum TaxID=5467 RepID=A0ACC3YFY4_COLTU